MQSASYVVHLVGSTTPIHLSILVCALMLWPTARVACNQAMLNKQLSMRLPIRTTPAPRLRRSNVERRHTFRVVFARLRMPKSRRPMSKHGKPLKGQVRRRYSNSLGWLKTLRPTLTKYVGARYNQLDARGTRQMKAIVGAVVLSVILCACTSRYAGNDANIYNSLNGQKSGRQRPIRHRFKRVERDGRSPARASPLQTIWQKRAFQSDGNNEGSIRLHIELKRDEMRTASKIYMGYQIEVVQPYAEVWQENIYPESPQAPPLNPALPPIQCKTKKKHSRRLASASKKRAKSTALRWTKTNTRDGKKKSDASLKAKAHGTSILKPGDLETIYHRTCGTRVMIAVVVLSSLTSKNAPDNATAKR